MPETATWIGAGWGFLMQCGLRGINSKPIFTKTPGTVLAFGVWMGVGVVGFNKINKWVTKEEKRQFELKRQFMAQYPQVEGVPAQYWRGVANKASETPQFADPKRQEDWAQRKRIKEAKKKAPSMY
eukprot:TRINITY_DN7260_c0_g1_i1.p3 TRINITY_DN7260_c0_g1~~TRINITY_DN7260_c0_g1_i1.p3  ORF type:complete len:145 (+),score=31.66 TRINITY_DN7260_c0_g1_i1:58-435(+)